MSTNSGEQGSTISASATTITPITTYIWHISDIHIGKVLDRYTEYNKVFDTLVATIDTEPSNTVVVITGDTFDHKTKLTPNDILCFDHLMTVLARYRVVIIPGNHDTNLNNPNAVDLITPIQKYPNVKYSTHTERFEINDVHFVHISIIDQPDEQTIAELISTTPNPVMLYHGIVDGVKFGKHVESGRDISTELINKTWLTLLGDIHEHQFMTPHAAYAGSLIQQNRGESMNKGIIKWNVASRTGKFVPIVNTERLKVKVYSDINNQNEIHEQAASIKTMFGPELNSNITITNITSSSGDKLNTEMEMLRREFGPAVNIINVIKKSHKLHSSQMECFEHIVRGKNYDTATTEKILEMHRANITDVNNSSWTINYAKWNNMLVYGERNHIDFASMSGITGVIAGNQMGKSSIIDVITYGLFGKPLRGDITDMLRYGTKKLEVEIEFVVNDVRYLIKRTREGKNQPHVLASFDPLTNSWKNITEQSVVDTNKKITDRIGTIDDFLSTGLYYDNRNDIIKMKPTGRIKELSRLFGLDNHESIIKQLQKTIKELKASMAKYQAPTLTDPSNEFNILAASIDNSNATISALINEQKSLNARLATITKLEDEHTAAQLARDQQQKLSVELKIVSAKIDELAAQITERILTPVPPCSFTEHAEYEKIKDEPTVNIELLQQRIADMRLPPVEQPTMTLHELREAETRLMSADRYDELAEHKLQSQRSSIVLKKIEKPSIDRETLTNKLQALQTPDITLEEYYQQREQLLQQMPTVTPCTEPTTTIDYADKEIAALLISADLLDTKIKALQSIQPQLPPLSILESSLRLLVPLPYKHNIESLTQTHLQLSQLSLYKFSNDCLNCQTNIKTINTQLFESKQNLDKALAEHKLIDEENAKISTNATKIKTLIERANELSSLISARDADLANIAKYNEIKSKHASYIAYKQAVERKLAIDAQLNELKARDTARREYETITSLLNQHNEYDKYTEHTTLLNHIDAELEKLANSKKSATQLEFVKKQIEQHELYHKYVINDTTIKQLELTIAKQKHADSILQRYTQYTKYNNYMNSVRESQLLKTKSELEGQIKLLQQTVPPDQTKEQLGIEKAALASELQRNRDLCHREYLECGKIQQKQDFAKSEIEKARIYETEYMPLASQCELLEAYVSCLRPKELQLAIVTKHIKEIEAQMNNYLSILTTFTCDFRISEDSIDIVVVNKGPPTTENCIETISGFQSFIISLVFRIVLTNELPRAADCIFIDEGFGVIDNENMPKVIKFLDEIQTNYRFMFIISHVEELQAVLQNPLTIQKTEHGHLIQNADNAEPTKLPTVEKLKITCECGAVISPHSVTSHNATAKHKKQIEEKKKLQNNQQQPLLQPQQHQPPAIIQVDNGGIPNPLKDIEKEAEGKYLCGCGSRVKNTKHSIEMHNTTDLHKRYLIETGQST